MINLSMNISIDEYFHWPRWWHFVPTLSRQKDRLRVLALRGNTDYTKYGKSAIVEKLSITYGEPC